MRFARLTACVLCGATLFCCGFGLLPVSARGQSPAADRPYDGLTAGAEAYRDAEAIRRQNVARQLNYVDFLKWYNGLPNIPTARQPIGHISTQTGPNRWEYHPIYAEDLAAAKPPERSPVAPVPPPPQPARDLPAATGRQAF